MLQLIHANTSGAQASLELGASPLRVDIMSPLQPIWFRDNEHVSVTTRSQV